MKKKKRNQNPRNISISCHQHLQIRIRYKKIEDDNVALQQQMTFLISRCPLYRVRPRAFKSISFFHQYPFREQSHPKQLLNYNNPLSSQEAWFVKVVCTLCLSKTNFEHCLSYFNKGLWTPCIAFEVISRLDDNLKLAFKFFEFSRISLNVNHSFKTYDLLIRSLCKMGLHDSAKLVFDCMRDDGHMVHRSVVSELFTSFIEAGKFDVAKGLLGQLEIGERDLGFIVYNNSLNILIRQNRVNEAVILFREHLLGLHSRPDTCSFNIIIRGMCRKGDVEKAFEFFNDMGGFGCSPDIITYNTLINGLCMVGEVDRGYEIFKDVRLIDDLSPDVVTYTSVIKGYCRLGKMDEASILFDEMFTSGVKPNTFTFNVLIDGFGKAGDMTSVMSMYEKMLFLGCQPDVITLTSIIDGYCRAGLVDQGLNILNEMNVRNVSPNLHTFAIIIHALCKENRLQEAREFLRHLKFRGIVPQAFVYNPVIDGLCKGGNVDEANLIVAEMEKKCKHDKMTFTILIIGHCMKGRMSEAISIFNKMMATNCTPDDITVKSLVSCLLKAGMANEAFQIKKIVSEDLNVGLLPLKRLSQSNASTDIPVAV